MTNFEVSMVILLLFVLSAFGGTGYYGLLYGRMIQPISRYTQVFKHYEGKPSRIWGGLIASLYTIWMTIIFLAVISREHPKFIPWFIIICFIGVVAGGLYQKMLLSKNLTGDNKKE